MHARTINLIAWDNGVGLSRDIQLLKSAWQGAGFEITETLKRRGRLRKWLAPARLGARMLYQRWRGDDLRGRFAYNVMLEHIKPDLLQAARRNVFIPNPEWFSRDKMDLLSGVDLVLTKTRTAEAIFTSLGCNTRYLGFTSMDRFDPGVEKRPEFFHLAGWSRHKGTEALLRLWSQHPEWPRLTVVQNPRMVKAPVRAPNIEHRVDYVSDAQLREMQNAHLFHLCPSETEGFGHYIAEALSVGAIVITLDAPPMNELVGADRGILAPYERTGAHGLATTYHFADEAICRAVETAKTMSAAGQGRLSRAARMWYEQNDREFRERAGSVLEG